MIFLPSHLSFSKKDRRRTTKVDLQRQTRTVPRYSFAPAITRPLTWPLCDVVSLCVQNFIPASELPHLSSSTEPSLSRICGAWMEVLPSLVGTPDDRFLSPAIVALGVSIVAKGHNGWAPIPDAFEARCVALRNLHVHIQQGYNSSFNTLAASMMCLFLAEVRIWRRVLCATRVDIPRYYYQPPLLQAQHMQKGSWH